MGPQMRRKDRQLTAAEAEAILRAGEYGVLATVCADGTPYGLPLSYAYAQGRLYFHHTAQTSLLRENVGGAARASFTVVGATEVLPGKFSTRYESAIAVGTLREAEDKYAGLLRLVEKYSPAYREEGQRYAAASLDKVVVYELVIEQLTGKARRT